MRLQGHPSRNEHALARQGDSTMILLDPGTGQYFTLNEVGARVWALCDGTRDVAEIVSLIAEEYDAPLEDIEADVIELLTDLENERLVVEAS